ncbi:hypothetical protein Zmor_017917 [Zophobas morio]|uniref:Uncharacterized protein n=1 Tax=Zophobas morio TaxID=2755281 RepID=A0AA38I608_9CUCU|nr:hypothetical protein Zmor_017917 [Zophobas morio]
MWLVLYPSSVLTILHTVQPRKRFQTLVTITLYAEQLTSMKPLVTPRSGTKATLDLALEKYVDTSITTLELLKPVKEFFDILSIVFKYTDNIKGVLNMLYYS